MLALKEKYGSKMTFIIANTDTNDGSAVAYDYNVQYIPTIYILNSGGKEVFNNVGTVSQSKLEEYIVKALDGK